MSTRPPEQETAPAVSLLGIKKVYPEGTLACADIDLEIRPGEVLALLGENGAGKTTLMHVLSGLLQPTAGEIRVDGSPVRLRNPHDALGHGIAMVHQHFLLVPPLTVAENVGLAREPGGAFVDRDALTADVLELSRSFGLELDPRARVADLPVGLQQRVEIVKALYAGARVLALDEPTSALTPQETGFLFKVLRDMAATRRSVVFISHKLREVKEVADRIVVLRQGRVVGEAGPEASEAELASLMVGRPVLLRVERPSGAPGRTVLELDRVEVAGRPGLHEVGLDVRAGEVLGIAGVDGNGQAELEEVLTGLRPLRSGSIRLEGHELPVARPRRIREAGVAHIPSDRSRWGLIREASLTENLALSGYYHAPVSRRGVLQPAAMHQGAAERIKAFDIRASSPDQRAATLSGGNQQKLIVAREVTREIHLLVACQPTRGIDVGATEFVHSELMRLRSEGVAVILISADLDEILRLSDRVAVLYEGRVAGVTEPSERDRIALWMAGATGEQLAS